jgi:hypothetical protein
MQMMMMMIMWYMKCFVTPLIIGGMGIVTKGLKKKDYVCEQYQERIQWILYKKKTAVLGTSHIIRKLLQSENLSLSGGVHQWFKRRSTRGKEIDDDDDDDGDGCGDIFRLSLPCSLKLTGFLRCPSLHTRSTGTLRKIFREFYFLYFIPMIPSVPC